MYVQKFSILRDTKTRQEMQENRVGGGLAAPVLPHHRTYSAVSGGFFQACSVTYR